MELVSSAAKRPREEDPRGALAAPSSKRPAAGIPRTSTLEAPTMLLTGILLLLIIHLLFFHRAGNTQLTCSFLQGTRTA